MLEKSNENNLVTVFGEVIGSFEFSHELYGESFFCITLLVKRLSDAYDQIPVMVSERIIDVHKDYKGRYMEAIGQFRSYNKREELKNRLVLSIFAKDVFLYEVEDATEKKNEIYLDGFVCKEPLYRKTPKGREIADVLLAVNRPYGRSDYIPCICWGRNARFAKGFLVGDHVSIWGRIQSREYNKRLDEDTCEKRVAYEISVSRLEQENLAQG